MKQALVIFFWIIVWQGIYILINQPLALTKSISVASFIVVALAWLHAENISFSIREGETVFITGESVIGKTTLLHIMMGLIKADSGKVSGISKKQACVFQEDRLLEKLTVIDNLKLVSGMADDDLKKECKKVLSEEAFISASNSVERRNETACSNIKGNDSRG